MKYENFEDVPVWKDAIDLSVRIFALTEDRAFQGRGDIANQIQRAGLSVSNNIAEGFERGTTPELIQFLYYSKGSAGEVRSICYVIERLGAFGHLKSEISDLKSVARSISRQLGGWLFSLQESDISGTRYLTEKSKAGYQQQKTAEDFRLRIQKTYEESMKRIQESREK
ncbi:MAG: four helix bundle protein [Kiritimatiellaceae bacterium]|nr:four helix bundle protein [Kiritimatiellaceae bacterium]